MCLASKNLLNGVSRSHQTMFSVQVPASQIRANREERVSRTPTEKISLVFALLDSPDPAAVSSRSSMIARVSNVLF